jgi:hypothetical protein
MTKRNIWKLELTDYDPDWCSTCYFESDESLFWYLADYALSELANADYDSKSKAVKDMVKLLKAGNVSKHMKLMEAINEFWEGMIYFEASKVATPITLSHLDHETVKEELKKLGF